MTHQPRAASASHTRVVGRPADGSHRAACWWQVSLAVYMQAILWIPLGRWNYQPCCRTGLEQLRQGTLTFGDGLGAAVFVLPLLVFWWGTRQARRWALWLAIVSYAVWLGLQLWTWWPPYIRGASEQWSQVYARAFAQSTPILPRWGNHLPPDAAHFVLQVLLLAVVASGSLTLLRRSGREAIRP
jgi:hypothetical protein